MAFTLPSMLSLDPPGLGPLAAQADVVALDAIAIDLEARRISRHFVTLASSNSIDF